MDRGQKPGLHIAGPQDGVSWNVFLHVASSCRECHGCSHMCISLLVSRVEVSAARGSSSGSGWWQCMVNIGWLRLNDSWWACECEE